ncbi:hypothetical protein [Chondromyces apiculatus]|nr:hypothetical protein [Chondromyces apiculatus]
MRHRTSHLVPLRHLLVLCGASLVAAGCGKTITDSDCQMVGERLQRAWNEEIRKAAPPQGTAGTKASGLLLSEEERLVTDWMAECKRDLTGKRVAQRELDCLLGATSLEQLSKCARP